MRNCHPIPHRCERPLVLVALGIVLCGWTSARAQPVRGDPVEELRWILAAPFADSAKRARAVKERIKALEGLGDLRRALVLREWRDEDQDQRIAVADRPNRLALARRFQMAVRDVLVQGDDVSRLAVLNMLAEMGTTTRGLGTRHGIARGFGPDLVELGKQGETAIWAAALRTLGQIDPEPEVALSAFGGFLSSEDAGQRLAAADGLACWMWTLAQQATRAADPGGVQVSRADFIMVGRAVLPWAARGLQAEQPEIRRRSALTIGYAATALHMWVLPMRSPGVSEDPFVVQRQREEQSAELLPLILALNDEAPALTHALVDPDAEVRFLATRALADMTIPRDVFLPPTTRTLNHASELAAEVPSASVRPSNFIPTSASAKDQEELLSTVQALAAQLSHADVEVRRAALEILETLGPDAAPATVELVGALRDRDKFVRWSAARTLGRIGPAEEEAVASALAQLLTDADLDVRLAAMTALEHLGPVAQVAAPDICRTVRSTDAELRLAAIRALAVIGGSDAQAAIPDISAAVADADARVRQAAIQVLGRLGPAARDAVPALRQALQDASPEVQKVAGEALLNILRPGKK
jgi:HEAT repeat protein